MRGRQRHRIADSEGNFFPDRQGRIGLCIATAALKGALSGAAEGDFQLPARQLTP